MNKSKGFTLIELVITVAIIGILAAVGTSLYESQSKKQRRSDAVVALTTAQTEMEQYRSDNGVYATAGLVTTTSPKGYYNVSVVIANSGENYTLTAEAVAGQVQINDTNCRKFIVTDIGQYSTKDASDADSNNCVQM